MLLLSSFQVFLSSFILFSIDPLVGKSLLPLYGGISIVWIIVVAIFMAILFLGYLYAHTISKFGLKKQYLIHSVLLIFSAAPLFLGRLGWYRFIPALFALSATTTLVQFWVAKWNTKKSPYPLLAIFSAGSLIGLLAYPFLIEPNLTTAQQTNGWTVLFLVFVLAMFGLLRLLRPAS